MLTRHFDRSEFYDALKQVEVRMAERIKEYLERHGNYSRSSVHHGNWFKSALSGFGARVLDVRKALDESDGIAPRSLQSKLGSISIESAWPMLRQICHDIALYVATCNRKRSGLHSADFSTRDKCVQRVHQTRDN